MNRELQYEDGAVLPRQCGKTLSRTIFLQHRINDLQREFGRRHNYKIGLVVSKHQAGVEIMKNIVDPDNVVVILTPHGISNTVYTGGAQLYDIVIDTYDLCTGNAINLKFDTAEPGNNVQK